MSNKYVSKTVLVIFILLFSDVFVFGHSGRTDRNGGHHDRKNGGYHYHNSGTVRRPRVTPSYNSSNKASQKRVYVRGYYRKDGTYVRPHYRTAPDGNPRNNYSYPGNYNPNTGKITPGDPQKYLDRYYNKSGNKSSPTNINQTSPKVPIVIPPVEKEQSLPVTKPNDAMTQYVNSQQYKDLVRKLNSPYGGSEISDETAMAFGFIAMIGFIVLLLYCLKIRYL